MATFYLSAFADEAGSSLQAQIAADVAAAAKTVQLHSTYFLKGVEA